MSKVIHLPGTIYGPGVFLEHEGAKVGGFEPWMVGFLESTAGNHEMQGKHYRRHKRGKRGTETAEYHEKRRDAYREIAQAISELFEGDLSALNPEGGTDEHTEGGEDNGNDERSRSEIASSNVAEPRGVTGPSASGCLSDRTTDSPDYSPGPAVKNGHDVVERLKEWDAKYDRDINSTFIEDRASDVICDAIAEIERLRAEIEEDNRELDVLEKNVLRAAHKRDTYRAALEKIEKHPSCHEYTGKIHEVPSPFTSQYERGYALGVEDGHRCCSTIATDALKTDDPEQNVYEPSKTDTTEE